MTTFDELNDRLRRGQRHLHRQAGEAKATLTRLLTTRDELNRLHADISNHEKAAKILVKFGEQRQTAVQTQIEALVTQGLRAIFEDDSLSFHVQPAVRSNRPEVDFVVRSTFNGSTVDTEVMDGRGGGLAATVGFLLRVVILLLSRDRQDTVLFLDETFAFLSEDRHPAMAQFLRELTDKTGIQIIMVTHTPALAEHADRIYRFDQTGGVTRVKDV